MPIFTRLRDILSADIDAMLARSADPEREARLIAQEIEDTLVETKASCAAAMATKKRAVRAMEEARSRASDWEAKARLAVQKGRDYLAREALLEKRRHAETADALAQEAAGADALVRQLQDDMTLLEVKLASVEEKRRALAGRRVYGRSDEIAVQAAPAAATPVPVAVERPAAPEEPKAEAGGRLEREFTRLGSDAEIENELQALKEDAARKDGEGPSTQQTGG